jgi:hypothetical protein
VENDLTAEGHNHQNICQNKQHVDWLSTAIVTDHFSFNTLLDYNITVSHDVKIILHLYSGAVITSQK